MPEIKVNYGDSEPEKPKKAKKLVVKDDNADTSPKQKVSSKKVAVTDPTPKAVDPVGADEELAAIASAIDHIDLAETQSSEEAPAENDTVKSDTVNEKAVKTAPELPDSEIDKTQTVEQAMQTAESVSETSIVNSDQTAPQIGPELFAAEVESANTSAKSSSKSTAAPEPVADVKVISDVASTPTKPEVADVAVPSEPEPKQSEEFSDADTAQKVDDIVAKESDELLERQDEDLQPVVAVPKPNKIKQLFGEWWVNPATKWGIITGFVLLIIAVCMLPTTRYAILNAAGVRVQASIQVNSSENQQPLKNADVVIAGQTIKTDEQGVAKFSKLKLGKTSIKISKRGYAYNEQTKVLGWGSNPLNAVSLQVTGSKFIFKTTDYLSGKAVVGAEANSGDFNAQSDKDGKIILPVDQDSKSDITVSIKANGYREEKLSFKNTDLSEKEVKMVASRPHVFISKRSGKLDIYKIDADGKNEKILLAATGSERDDMIILPMPTDNYVAVVSTREGQHNKAGYLLSNLFLVNINSGELTKLNQSERIQLVDWAGDRLIFIAVTEGASAANPARSKLFSYQIDQPGAKQIASANYFNDAVVFKNSVYYAPSSYAIPVASVKFYKINPDGTNQSSILDKEVWNIFRSNYDTLLLSVQQEWYELTTGNVTATKLSTSPANPKTITYRDSPNKKQALWVDNRDGKGVLLSYVVDSKKDEILQTQSGLVNPVYWLNDTTFVFRISDGRETADYVKSTEGGNAKKLRDVTNTDTANYFN